MTTNGQWTPTQTVLMNALLDGKRHHRSELVKLLPDDMTDPYNPVKQPIFQMRKKLHVMHPGHEIVCVARSRTTFYQLVTLISRD